MGVQRQQQSGHLKVLLTDISLTEDAIVREIVMLKTWGLLPVDLNSKECFFEADKRRSAFLRGGLQESGGVVGEM